jgi:hypothetical protein
MLLASVILFAFGLGLGQYPSLRGGAEWGIDPAFGEVARYTRVRLQLGTSLGVGCACWGWFTSGARAGLGRRLSAQFFLLFSCPCFTRAGLITARKGDIRAAASLTILHLYTRRLYSVLYGLPWTVIEHRVINC